MAVIKIPGSMVDFFRGGDAGQGRPDSETGYHGGEALYKGLEDGKRVRVGKWGYYIVADLTDEAIDVLRRYADVCLVANSDEPDYAEVNAARTTLRRIVELPVD